MILERRQVRRRGRCAASRSREEHPDLRVVTAIAQHAEQYAIRASTAPLVLDEETEPNDTPAAASPLADVPGAASGTRVGTLAAGDVDVYRLDPAEGSRQLSATLAPPKGVDAVLAVLADDGVTALTAPADATKAGGEEKVVAVAIPPGKAALLKLTGKAGDAGERYRLRWSVVETAARWRRRGWSAGVDD